MEKRINTSKTLHNSYFDGNNYDTTFNNNTPIQVHQDMYAQYDYAVTEDPELLNDRKDSEKLVYQIFSESIYNDGRFYVKDTSIIKIPKEQIGEIYNFVKAELQKVKKLNPVEQFFAINEFFDFNYEYVFKKVMNPQQRQEILEDVYKNEGMKAMIDKGASIKLF